MSGDDVLPGGASIVHDALAAIAFEGAPATRLDLAAAAVIDAITALSRDPRAYLTCVHEHGGEDCWP
jgi:hypothetical protein